MALASQFCAFSASADVTKEDVMRKVLILALVSMFFTTMACNKSEETPASPEASASMAPSEEASPAASAAAPETSPAESPAASPAGS